MEDSEQRVSGTPRLRNQVVDILGNLEAQELNHIIKELDRLGVFELGDLCWVKEDDLKELKPVHARKLLRSCGTDSRIEPREGSSSSGCSTSSTPGPTPAVSPAPSNASSSSSSTSSVFSPGPILHTTDPNWPVRMSLPWGELNTLTRQSLENGERLNPTSKKELVHKTVNSVRMISKHATRQQYCTIAQRMVAKYTDSLQDKLDGRICGSGYETLLNKLVSRNQNLNRPEHTRLCLSAKKRSSSDGSSEGNDSETPDKPKKTPMKDSYGCVSWSPEIESATMDEMEEQKKQLAETFTSSNGAIDEQVIELMKSTYPIQRRDINGEMTMLQLKEQWPYLFSIKGLQDHASELMGRDVRNELGTAYTTKAPRLNNFFRTIEGNDFIFKEAHRQSNEDNLKAWLSAVILCTMKRLGDKEEDLFYVVDETSTLPEIQASGKTESPVLVVFGDSILSGKSFSVMCDHVILCQRSQSFIDSFSAYFACFYIFNLEYPQGAASTLEFIQRSFIGINPDRGSKGNKGRKKKMVIAPKVLRFINELSDFEWLQA